MWPVSSTAWVSAQKSAENPNKAQTAIPHAVLFFVCFRMYNFIVKAVCRELYRAIRADCWLAVEYHNRKNETTSYWIAVRDLNPRSRRLLCDGMHLGSFSIASLNLYLDQIVSAKMIRGTYAEIPETLRNDIRDNPEKYESVFAESANFAILTYLSECFRLDESPYRTDFSLVGKLDDEKVDGVSYSLSDEQFAQIVRSFVKETDDDFKGKLSIKQFGMNLLSVATAKGMYLLAYQPLRLNVGARALGAFDPPVICTENTINGKKQSVRSFLDPEFHYLLNDFKANAEKIREIITVTNPGILVDDMPYVLEVARDSLLDLPSEYEGIFAMYDEERVTVPVAAFFGQLTQRPRKAKAVPMALLSRQINLDQLLAMNHAMRYPLSYIQGPPGTGKTMTIVNTILSAFYNHRTVLFASYNNHPIDEAVGKLKSFRGASGYIPFPVIRLGSNEETLRSLKMMKKLIQELNSSKQKKEKAFKDSPSRMENAKNLSDFLDEYENTLNLIERKDALDELLKNSSQMNFTLQLETEQKPALEKKIKEGEKLNIDKALRFVNTDFTALKEVLYRMSRKCLERIKEPAFDELRAIVSMKDETEMVKQFNSWLNDEEHLKAFLRIFPVIATTCISAYKLSSPKPHFDMVILDEASQCNTAVSLVPLIRGKSLMLVGDPQQLQPVILLDEADNAQLKEKYGISDEYDYRTSSIYKTMLACDPVSDEVLLSHHYRCDPKIIGFSNRKYYNSKLKMDGRSVSDQPLVFVDVDNDVPSAKNTAPAEAEAIVRYIKDNPSDNIGVITPFVRQKEYIKKELESNGIDNVDCGTVHAFQGDEKDVILFSLALSDHTRPETYAWLRNNRELINVSTSRARQQLYLFTDSNALERLHDPSQEDDLYDLACYVRSAGTYQVTPKPVESRALGIRPYSTATEEAFLENLTHALDNAFSDGSHYTVHKEVPVSQVFMENISSKDYFYRGRFDFVVYRKYQKKEIPVLAVELDGMEHLSDHIVKARDEQKEAICREHGFELIRVDNTYARRYHYIKEILTQYFRS